MWRSSKQDPVNHRMDYRHQFLGRPGRRKLADKMPAYQYPKCVKSTYEYYQNQQNNAALNPLAKSKQFNLEQVPRVVGHFETGNKTLA